MQASRRAEPPRRPRFLWRNVILAGLVFAGVVVYLKLAAAKFRWWREARFAGQVVGKEARRRDTDESVPPALALQEPRAHRFYLLIDGEEGVARHEVVRSAFEQVAVGDSVEKRAGSYQVRPVPAPREPRPGEPET